MTRGILVRAEKHPSTALSPETALVRNPFPSNIGNDVVSVSRFVVSRARPGLARVTDDSRSRSRSTLPARAES